MDFKGAHFGACVSQVANAISTNCDPWLYFAHYSYIHNFSAAVLGNVVEFDGIECICAFHTFLCWFGLVIPNSLAQTSWFTGIGCILHLFIVWVPAELMMLELLSCCRIKDRVCNGCVTHRCSVLFSIVIGVVPSALSLSSYSSARMANVFLHISLHSISNNSEFPPSINSQAQVRHLYPHYCYPLTFGSPLALKFIVASMLYLALSPSLDYYGLLLHPAGCVGTIVITFLLSLLVYCCIGTWHHCLLALEWQHTLSPLCHLSLYLE